MPPRRPNTGTKIFSNAFSSGSAIEHTNLTNGKQTRTALSSINTSGRATISYAMATAVMAAVSGRCSIAKVPEGYWCECLGRNTKYVLKYKDAAQTLEVFGFDLVNKAVIPAKFVDGGYVHWSVFVPLIAQILYGDPSGTRDFSQNLDSVRREFEARGSYDSMEEMFVLNDYMYESRHEYIQDNREVVIATTQFLNAVAEDLTPRICGKPGTFEFLQVPVPKTSSPTAKRKPKNISSKAVLNTDEYTLGWNRMLEPDEEVLIPTFDLDLMKITDSVKRLAFMVKAEQDSGFPVNNIILYGEAGAGKTTAAKLLAQLWGIPYRFINLSLNSEESDLIGTYRPKEDGSFEFFLPAFAQSYQHGGIIELMEVNYARPGALGVLNSALDDTSKITLGNGEVVERHPNCIIVASTNVDYSGCQRMNEALKDRFHQLLLVEKMSKDDLVEIAARASGNQDTAMIAKMVDAVQKISIKVQEEQLSGGVCSTRQLINWARDVKYTGDPVESAKNTILPGVSLDLTIQKEIIDTILKPMF